MADDAAALVEAEIKEEEGWRPLPYRDTRNLLTVGYGFLIEEGRATPMPREVGDLWLRMIVAGRVAALDARIPWWRTLTPVRQRVLLQMAYQMGAEGLFKFKNTLAAIQAGRYEEGARGMKASLWAKQTPERAERMAELMKRG